VALAADDSVQFGRHLAHRASAPASPLLLPAHRAAPVLAPAEGVLGFITPGGDLDFERLDALPSAPRPGVRVLTLESHRLTFMVDTPGAYPEGTTFQFEYRPAGGDASWQPAHMRDAETVGVLDSLAAKTDYLLRIKARSGPSDLSDWSEPLRVRTLIAAPSLPYRADQLSIQPGAVIDTILQVNGEDTVVTLENLPPGLHYDQATRRLTGIYFPDTIDGRHEARLVAVNAGGRLESRFILYPSGVGEAAKPFGTYEGLIDTSRKHLVGSWRVTFSGDTLTGLYRGVLGDVSFKGRLVQEPSSGWYYGPRPPPSFLFERKLSKQDTLNFKVEWLNNQNRVVLTVGEAGLHHEPQGETTRFTGYSSTWHAAARPLPEAGAHTALLLPDDTDSYVLSPRPYGVGFFSMKTRADGRAEIKGETATGHPFTQSAKISNLRVLPLFARLGGHTHWAELRLDPVSPQIPVLSGDWRWEAISAAGPAYPFGVRETFEVVGAPFPEAGKAVAPLNPLANPSGQAELLLSGAGLARLPALPRLTLETQPSGFGVPLPGSAGNPHQIALSLAATTGLLTGSATLPDPVKTPPMPRVVKLRGQLVKNPLRDGRDLIGGYLLFPDAKGLARSSRLEITEPITDPDSSGISAPSSASRSGVVARGWGSSVTLSSGQSTLEDFVISVSSVPTLQVAPDRAAISTATVRGALAHAQALRLTAAPEVSWTLSSDRAWLVPSLATGSGNAEITLEFLPGALPVGVHNATLMLSDGTVSMQITVALTVEDMSITKLVDDTTAARAYALSLRSIYSSVSHLLKIDANDGRVLRTVVIPTTMRELAFHAGDGLLYLADQTQNSVSARSPDSLEPVRGFSYATLPAGTSLPDARTPKRLFPGRAGRMLVEFGNNYYYSHALRWLDTSDGSILATYHTSLVSTFAFHTPTERLFYYGSIHANYYKLGIVAFDLSTDSFTQAVSVEGNLPYDAPAFLSPGPAPHLYVGGRIYDADLTPTGLAPEPILAASPDETVLVGRHVAYVGGEMRSLPAANFRVFNQAARRVVSASSTSITASDPDALPVASPVALSVAAVGDTWVRIVWSEPGPHVPGYAGVVLQSRLLGDAAWRDHSVYSSAQSRELLIDGNNPEGTAEFRLRFKYDGGYFLPFSEPVAVTFLQARPGVPSHPGTTGEMRAGVEGSLALPFTGEDLEFKAEDLPRGLRYDPATQSLVGVPVVPGRYEIRVEATNVSGTAVRALTLLVRTDTARARGARYNGLLDLGGGPLSGIWSATRSLDQITGTYRSPLFTRSFKVNLRAVFWLPGKSLGTTTVTYDGVPIHLVVTWDHAIDRLRLEAYTIGLVEDFRATTTEETGLASHWWGGTLPYPRAAATPRFSFPARARVRDCPRAPASSASTSRKTASPPWRARRRSASL
jgi:hypothetical protein